MGKISAMRRLGLGLGTSALLVGMVAGPAFASDTTVTQAITAGSLSASVTTPPTFASVALSNTAQNGASTMTLTADDATDSSLGWHVTMESSAFTSGSNTIAAADFTITTAALPVVEAGTTSAAVDFAANTGRQAPTQISAADVTLDAALGSPVTVVTATPGYGQGGYTQALGLNLLIPGGSPVGTYTGTLTTTIVSGI